MRAAQSLAFSRRKPARHQYTRKHAHTHIHIVCNADGF